MYTKRDLTFHAQGKDVEEIEKAATLVADQFFGYKSRIENPDFGDGSDATIPRQIDNPEERPYKMEIEGQAIRTIGVYAYSTEFNAHVRCFIPRTENDW